MKLFGKVKKYIADKDYRISVNRYLGLYNILSDKMFLKFIFRWKMKRNLDLDNPQTFNEKIQWLKINDRRPEYKIIVDKCAAKKVISEIIGEQYVIPTIGVYEKFSEINFEVLPDKFVLKCTHDSGGLVICKDKSTLNKAEAKNKINKSLRKNYYWHGREWPYKGVPHRILCEEYIEDSNGELNDYKFFCFDGLVDCVMVVADRQKDNAKFYYMSREWKVLPYGRLTRSLPDDFTLPKPEKLDEMFQIAEKLSKGFPHVRIDLYNVDGRILFGEYTLYSQSGLEDGFDYASDKHLGDLIVLPSNDKRKIKEN